MAYDKNTDYQALINKAVANKDTASAANYEQLRNEKIVGERLNRQYATTNNYSGVLDSLASIGNTSGAVKTTPYYSAYDNQINAQLQDLINIKPFEYDYTKDPVYQSLEKQYTQLGAKAMEDTLGAVSSHTGGLASSYAGTASQQAYNDYMSQLSGYIPQLEENAYNRYKDGINQGYDTFGLLSGLENQDYGRYRDGVGDLSTNNKLELSQKEDIAKTMASIGDFSQYKDLGYTDEQIAALSSYWQSMNAPTYSGGGYSGGGSRGGSSSGTTEATSEEQGVLATMLGFGDDVSAYDYLGGQGYSSTQYSTILDMYNSLKDGYGSSASGGGTNSSNGNGEAFGPTVSPMYTSVKNDLASTSDRGSRIRSLGEAARDGLISNEEYTSLFKEFS